MARKPAKNFEDALSRLELITQTMRNGEMPLEEAVAAYKEGVELARFCRQRLDSAEQTVLMLDNEQLKEIQFEHE